MIILTLYSILIFNVGAIYPISSEGATPDCNSMRLSLLSLCCLALFTYLPNISLAQLGGQSILSFSRFPTSTRVLATGKRAVTQTREDVSLLSANPALLGPEMDGWASFSFLPIITGAFHSSVSTAFSTKKTGPIGISVRYIDYGDMVERDQIGNQVGEFTAGAYQVMGHYAVHSDVFSLGFSGGLASETIAEYTTTAILGTASALYEHPDGNTRVGLVVENVGVFLDETNTNELPIDIKLGVSHKLEHLPLRFSITAHHLHQYDIVYLDPDVNTTFSLSGEEVSESKSTGDIIARHFSVGAEIILSKQIQVFGGYDHLTRRELKLENEIGAAGFSIGGQLKIKYFALQVGHAWHHSAGGFTQFTLQTDWRRLLKSNG